MSVNETYKSFDDHIHFMFWHKENIITIKVAAATAAERWECAESARAPARQMSRYSLFELQQKQYFNEIMTTYTRLCVCVYALKLLFACWNCNDDCDSD